MNKVIIIGRLTTDPKVTVSSGEDQMSIARFTLAVDRRKKDSSADFPSCIAFGKTADFIGNYFRKGMKIVIEGHIQTGSYTNKDGQKVYTTDVVADNVEFAESKGSSEPVMSEEGQKVMDEFMQVPDGLESELPFM